MAKQLESTVRFVGLREAGVETGVSLIDCIQRISFVEIFFLQRARIDPGGNIMLPRETSSSPSTLFHRLSFGTNLSGHTIPSESSEYTEPTG